MPPCYFPDYWGEDLDTLLLMRVHPATRMERPFLIVVGVGGSGLALKSSVWVSVQMMTLYLSVVIRSQRAVLMLCPSLWSRHCNILASSLNVEG